MQDLYLFDGLFNLKKSLKISLVLSSPIIITITVVLCTYISDSHLLTAMIENEYWISLSQPYIWQSSLVQALLSTHIVSGYIVSAGGSVYKHSDVRWTSTFITITNFLSGWIWVFFWRSISSDNSMDSNFLSILVLIYQSSVSEKRSKEWPLLAFGIVFVSGIITLLTLLFPVYHKLYRLAGENWRIFAAASSALGTALTVTVLAQGINVAVMLDELVIPVLAVFTTVVEIVGFVFIYGLFYLSVDIYFITGSRIPWFWLVTWWMTPILLMGVTGWWLRELLRSTWDQSQTLWPLGGVLIGILVVIIVIAAVAVAKEEQFNLFSKISSTFRPSRLWGPEEPLSRYVWMSQRSINEKYNCEYEYNINNSTFNNIINKYHLKGDEIDKYWNKSKEVHQCAAYVKSNIVQNKNTYDENESIYAIPNSISNISGKTEKQHKTTICISRGELGGPVNCSCNRHFQLKVPDLRNNELSTSL